MHLFHAVALYNYYAHARRQSGIAVDQEQLVSEVVLAAISIPSKCIEYEMPKKQFTQNWELLSTTGITMTKEVLIHNVKNGLYLKLCDKNIKELFSLFTGGKNMLVFSKTAAKCFKNLEGNEELKKFLPLVEENLIAHLIERISKLYKTMSFDSFKKLTGFLNFEKCENQILYSNTQGVSITLNMDTNMLIFGHE